MDLIDGELIFNFARKMNLNCKSIIVPIVYVIGIAIRKHIEHIIIYRHSIYNIIEYIAQIYGLKHDKYLSQH